MGYLDVTTTSQAQAAAQATADARPGEARIRPPTRRGRWPASRTQAASASRRMKQEVARGFFTSDLSINHVLLVKQSGFEPLGGAGQLHLPHRLAAGGVDQSQELAVLTQAMYHARESAMTRMEEEANQLGADGIVGVRLDIGRYEWGADLAEFIFGRHRGQHRGGSCTARPTAGHRERSGRRKTGHAVAGRYRPVGMVMGNCVYHVGRRGCCASLSRMAQRGDAQLHPGLYEARELAMERMQSRGRRAPSRMGSWAPGSSSAATAGART